MIKDNSLNIVLREIKKRLNGKEKYSIIGTELRNIRVSRSQTIEAVCSDVCSASYLCKVERGNIVPNKQLLSELFDKLEISSEKLNILMSMESILEEAVSCFVFNNIDKINSIYKQCKDFFNYRAMLIKFIYYLINNDIKKAEDISNDLDNLISTMTTKDFTCHVVFKAILFYKTGFYSDCYNHLNCIKETTNSINYVRIINLYKFYSSFKNNSKQIYFDYKAAIDSFIYCGDYSLMDNINYLYSINLIYNNIDKKSLEVIEGIADNKMKTSALIYHHLMFDEGYDPSMKDYNSCRDMFKLYLVLKLKKSELYDKLDELKNSTEIEFELLFFEYKALNNELEKYQFIEKIFDNESILKASGYFKEFIINELALLSTMLGKYKLLSKAYISLR